LFWFVSCWSLFLAVSVAGALTLKQVGATPLHLAVLLEDGDRIVDLLLSEGADFNEPKAVSATEAHPVALSLAHPPSWWCTFNPPSLPPAHPMLPGQDGLTPLHEACWCGNEYAVRLFLSREAKIELIDGVRGCLLDALLPAQELCGGLRCVLVQLPAPSQTILAL
jgi:hypothetical protein